MKLFEWKSIPQEQQRELIIQWSQNDHWSDYENMAFEAARALEEELSSIPEIMRVEPSGGEVLHVEPLFPARELIINVYTSLPESSRLKQIPTRFSGFSVCQVNLADKHESFLKTWKRLFKELKGWDETTTMKWAEQWAESLSGRQTSAIYHYGPVKTALPNLIDESLKKTAGERLQFLYNDIRDVIEHSEGTVNSPRIEHPDTVENYDWEYVRRRMAILIEKYSGEVTGADKKL